MPPKKYSYKNINKGALTMENINNLILDNLKPEHILQLSDDAWLYAGQLAELSEKMYVRTKDNHDIIFDVVTPMTSTSMTNGNNAAVDQRVHYIAEGDVPASCDEIGNEILMFIDNSETYGCVDGKPVHFYEVGYYVGMHGNDPIFKIGDDVIMDINHVVTAWTDLPLAPDYR